MQRKNTRRGFTLIELLIVVLIIGILAAVAVPQYQKAVEKSRATQALAVLSTLYQAAEVYYLANGDWPSSVNNLDVDSLPINNEEWRADIEKTDQIAGVRIMRISGKYTGTSFVKYKKHPYGLIPKQQILCMEQHSHDTYLYTGKQGSYCKQILGGKDAYVGEDVWASAYTIPVS